VKLSAKTEYGCLAMLHLAEMHGQGEPVQIRKVAAEHDIPWRFLVQILLELKRAGLVASTRGAAGGYRLARPPEDISLSEVMQVLEGQDAPRDPMITHDGLRGTLHQVCNEAYVAQQEALSAVTLDMIVRRASDHREPMWYI
jgi:Rrf2 family cysteine metabolism transcriptional repressor